MRRELEVREGDAVRFVFVRQSPAAPPSLRSSSLPPLNLCTQETYGLRRSELTPQAAEARAAKRALLAAPDAAEVAQRAAEAARAAAAAGGGGGDGGGGAALADEEELDALY